MLLKAFLALLLMLGMPTKGAAEPAAATTIVLAGEDDWPPYSFADKRSLGAGHEPTGFSPRLIRAAFASQGINVRFISVPFSRCMRLALTDQVAGCFNASITNENRNDYIWHSPPMFKEELSIFGAPGNDATPLTLADLRGKNVAITNGYTYPSAFVNDSRISKFPANSDDNLIQMFLSKRVDYVVMNRTPGWLRIDATDAARGRLVHRGALSADEFWIAFSKKYPGAQQASDTFGKGLTQMRNNGSYQAMLDEFRKQVKFRQ